MASTLVSSPAPSEGSNTTGESEGRIESAPGDRLSEKLLAEPVTVLLGLICLMQLATWIPHYLTWPLWADHDVFTTLARGWQAGVLPFRDLACNQFPGAIYLCWILGRIAGWGNSMAIYAFDAAAIILLGIGLVLWSRHLFGRALPGIVGYLSFLSYYLAFDYTHAAQRDWYTPLFVVLGLLILQTSRGTFLAPAVAGASMSIAMCFRPHAALFLPAVALQLMAEIRDGGSLRRTAVWGLSLP